MKAEIRGLYKNKCKDIPELSDKDWTADFAFAVDVTFFMRKLQFLSSQLKGNTLTHMQTLKKSHYHQNTFALRSIDYPIKDEMHMISSPLTYSVDSAPVHSCSCSAGAH